MIIIIIITANIIIINIIIIFITVIIYQDNLSICKVAGASLEVLKFSF